MKYIAQIGQKEITLQVDRSGKIVFHLSENGEIPVNSKMIAPNRYSILLDGQSFTVNVHRNSRGFDVTHRNQLVNVLVKDEVDVLREQFGMGDVQESQPGIIQAPIPGMVVNIAVEEGDQVQSGDRLLILEAMKMENEIKSPVDGVVKQIHVSQGDNIDKDTVLVEVE